MQLPANVPGEQGETTQMFGPLPPRVGEQDGIAAPGFSLAQDAEAVWGVNQQMEDSHIHSLSVSQIKLSESFKQERNKCYRK